MRDSLSPGAGCAFTLFHFGEPGADARPTRGHCSESNGWNWHVRNSDGPWDATALEGRATEAGAWRRRQQDNCGPGVASSSAQPADPSLGGAARAPGPRPLPEEGSDPLGQPRSWRGGDRRGRAADRRGCHRGRAARSHRHAGSWGPPAAAPATCPTRFSAPAPR